MKDPAINLVIEIFLNAKKTSNLLKEDLPAFKDQIYEHVESLLQDLGIPAQVNLSITRKKDLDPLLLLRVNGNVCRLPYKVCYLHEISQEILQKEILAGILLNRNHLINTGHARAIREIWSSRKNQRYLSNLSAGEFFDYLQLLIKYGYKIDRGDQLNPFDFPSQPLLAFEQAVSGINNIRLVLYFSKEKSNIKQKHFLKKLREKLPLMQEILFFELGVRIPMVQLKEDAGLGKEEFSIQINDLRLEHFHGLGENEILVKAGQADLLKMNLEGRPGLHPISNQNCYIVKETGGIKEKFHASGIETWDPVAYVELCLTVIIQNNAGNFLTLEGLDFELDYLNQAFPDLLMGYQQKHTLDFLIRVLRELLKDKISIRDLKGIMEAILGIKDSIKADFNEKIIFIPSPFTPLFSLGEASMPDQPDPSLFAESIRVSQKKYISQKYSKGQGTLWVYLLDPELEKLFLDPDKEILAGKKDEIHQAIADEVQKAQNVELLPLILTSIEIRRPLKALIQVEFPYLEVLSYLEISPETNIQLLGKIALLSK